ncbi:MAG: phosphoadenylyl-sulfate reductase [Candidatus Dormibacteria bacterium]
MHELASPVQPADLPDLATRLEAQGADAVLAWTVAQFGGDLALACSFQDCVIVDLAVRHAPRLEVVFLDSGSHFPETLEYVEEVRARYRLNLSVTQPGPEAEAWPCGTEECCRWRKVEPLALALRGKGAWVTGLKRCDGATRASIQVLEWDQNRGMVKVNPLAAWSDAEVEAYALEHGLPSHPLSSRGYPSIGCAPTTLPVAAGADPRSGRWAGTDKAECGLHA